MKRCPYCNSIYVCWNWFQADDGDWGHECWECENVFITQREEMFGLPGRILRRSYENRLAG
jgi:hypothetical protein